MGSESHEHSDSQTRKRVGKACDRCRLKKSKCDGAHPCSRCKLDNSICFYGERKKSTDKVYPKGYVEILELQQAQLVAGLRKAFTILLQCNQFPGGPMDVHEDGYPLTHNILHRLDVLKQPDHHIDDSLDHVFEDNIEKLQERLHRKQEESQLQQDQVQNQLQQDTIAQPERQGTDDSNLTLTTPLHSDSHLMPSYSKSPSLFSESDSHSVATTTDSSHLAHTIVDSPQTLNTSSTRKWSISSSSSSSSSSPSPTLSSTITTHQKRRFPPTPQDSQIEMEIPFKKARVQNMQLELPPSMPGIGFDTACLPFPSNTNVLSIPNPLAGPIIVESSDTFSSNSTLASYNPSTILSSSFNESFNSFEHSGLFDGSLDQTQTNWSTLSDFNLTGLDLNMLPSLSSVTDLDFENFSASALPFQQFQVQQS